MKTKIWILFLALTGIVVNLTAQTPAVIVSDKPGWHKIGERNVDFSTDRDEILVMGADRFAAIKFKVTGAAIDLQSLEVYYETGDKQEISVRTPIQAGYESRVFDLTGSEKSLKKIVFVYKTLSNSKDEKAQVEVWGRKTNAGTTSEAKAKTPETAVPSPSIMVSDKKGWHKIGERKVDFVKDRDEVLVLGADRFAMIKFIVTGASIDLLDLEVYFENGEKQDIQVRTPILAGSESRTIELNGAERSLKKIVFVYSSLPNHKDEKAHVEIWGLKTNIN